MTHDGRKRQLSGCPMLELNTDLQWLLVSLVVSCKIVAKSGMIVVSQLPCQLLTIYSPLDTGHSQRDHDHVVCDRMRPWPCIRSVSSAGKRERCVLFLTPLKFNMLMCLNYLVIIMEIQINDNISSASMNPLHCDLPLWKRCVYLSYSISEISQYYILVLTFWVFRSLNTFP